MPNSSEIEGLTSAPPADRNFNACLALLLIATALASAGLTLAVTLLVRQWWG